MTGDPNLFATLSSCKGGTVTFVDDCKGKIISICHAPLPKICENRVAMRIDNVYTREKIPHLYTLSLK